MRHFCLAAALVALPTLASTQSRAPTPPDRDYLVWVGSEATDRIALIRFGPKGARIDHEFMTGIMPTDPDGPHGLGVSPDGRYLYVSTAHGTPYGRFWKYDTKNDSLIANIELGNFPATLQLTPDGAFAYVVNFNLHGEMVPSSVSVVSTDEMVEVARITTCVMPHGSRIDKAGFHQYSACMMSDLLIDIDTRELGVVRHFSLTKGQEMGMAGAPNVHTALMGGMSHDAGGHGMENPKPGDISCSPTWAQPSADGSRVYVACNKSSEIVEIDAVKWTLLRRMPAGNGVYNLAVTHDGSRLLATNKRDQSVSIIEISSGRELARIRTQRRVVHGVVVSPDDRYAFISVEGFGSEPGTVEIIDLRTLSTAARVDIGQQPGGIDFWKTEAPR